MIEFLSLNLGTIVSASIVAALILTAIVQIIRSKRKGKCVGCDCGCAECPRGMEK